MDVKDTSAEAGDNPRPKSPDQVRHPLPGHHPRRGRRLHPRPPRPRRAQRHPLLRRRRPRHLLPTPAACPAPSTASPPPRSSPPAPTARPSPTSKPPAPPSPRKPQPRQTDHHHDTTSTPAPPGSRRTGAILRPAHGHPERRQDGHPECRLTGDRQLDRPGPGIHFLRRYPLRKITRSGVTSPYPALHATSTSASIIRWANSRIIAHSTSGLADARVSSNCAPGTGTMSPAATLLSFVAPKPLRRIARWPPRITATRRTPATPSHQYRLPHTPLPWT